MDERTNLWHPVSVEKRLDKPTISCHDKEPWKAPLVLVTYESSGWNGRQKCLDHLKRNIDEVLETKTGRARSFGLKPKGILQDARQLWRDQRAGKANHFQARAEPFARSLNPPTIGANGLCVRR